MIVVKRKLGPLSYIRRWFSTGSVFADRWTLTAYSQYLGPNPPGWGFRKVPFTTVHLDLRLSPEEIFTAFKKNTAYEVRRAEKDGVLWDLENGIEDFLAFYNDFAAEKALPFLGTGQLASLGGHLVLTRARTGDQVLARHAYLIDLSIKRARLLYSASARFTPGGDRAMMGRANRFCHWKDILYFKSQGFELYDWGGIMDEGDEGDRQGIDQFKKSFGGSVVQEPGYDSWLFSFAKWLRRV